MVHEPGGIERAAAEAGFGRPGGTYHSLRRVPAGAALALMGGAAVTGTMLALAGRYVPAILVAPLMLIALAVVRYRLPPLFGKRWLMLYEHGMVELVLQPRGGRAQVRLIRYSDVTGVLPDALTLAPGPGHPEPILRLAELNPAPKLRAALAAHLPGLPWPAGQAGARATAVLTGVGLAALALVPLLVPVTHALTASPAAETTAPATRHGTATPATSAGTVTGSPSASAVPAGATAPSIRALPMPTSTEGFYDLCRGTAMVPDAPAFAGPPPHLVYATIPTYTDPKWWASTPERVQLVVCTESSAQPGTKVRTCRYQLSNGTSVVQQLIKGTWAVVIREARTGREVARSSVVGGDESCGQVPDLDYATGVPQYSEHQLTKATPRQVTDNVGKYVLQ